MSHVVVVSTDFRRVTVKVSPGTPLLDVLQEACVKFKASSDKFNLKHANKVLNLTTPFRLSGLTQGAKLELVAKSKTASAVRIALNLPDSQYKLGRLVGTFRSDTPLWKLLRQFEEQEEAKKAGVNLTARGVAKTSNGPSGAGRLYWEAPVLRIGTREHSTLEDFKKTLSQAGLSSGDMIWTTFKPTEMTLVDAMREVGTMFQDGDTEAPKNETTLAGSSTAAVVDGAPVSTTNAISEVAQPPHLIDHPAAPAAEGLPSQPNSPPQASSPPVNVDPLAPTGVFAPSSSSTIAATKIRDPDSAFTPSIAHMQLHQKHLIDRTHNQRLKSDQELEADAAVQEARVAAVKQVNVRVRFPDGYFAQWTFGPKETGASLHQAVRQALAQEQLQFKLVPAGGGADILDQDGERHTLIKGYGLKGGVLVNLVLTGQVAGNLRQQTFLKQSVKAVASELVAPKIPEGVVQEEARPVKSQKKDGGSSSGDGPKIPKWLKLPGKK